MDISFEQQLKQWIAIDTQLKIIHDRTKELRDKKSKLTEQINQHIETNELTNTSIKLSDGQLKFMKLKETQTLSFKFLESCLTEIITNEEQVKQIIEYIKNKREIRYVQEIKRLYNN
jgi:nitrogen regulatory protein PII